MSGARTVVSFVRDDHVFVFGGAACGVDDRTFGRSQAQGKHMASGQLWIAESPIVLNRTLKTMPATRTPQNYKLRET